MGAEERDQGLTGKRHTLLTATVAEFIATAQPVGSQQVAGRHNIGIKSAMARNVMAELEELGYLLQPHTSAGRVPTDKAFRYYVDHLADSTRIAFRDRTRIELHYSERGRDLLTLMRDTPRLLSLLTGQAAIVMSPRLETVEIEHVNFVRLRESEVLALFVTKAATVQNRVVTSERDHSQDELDRMARYLNESLHGRTLDQARRWIESQLREERARYDSFMREALEFGDAVTGHIEGSELYVEGSVKALEQPEFSDPERVKDLLRALEDKTALLQLLERSLEQHSLTVSIGSENISPKLATFSIVAAPYTGGAKPPGSVAVVGPVRMDYERVIPLVDYTAKALSRVLGQ